MGSAANFRKRFAQHRRLLSAGDHHSRKLQNAWSKYGEKAFEFSVLEVVLNPVDLIQREQFWLDSLEAVRTGYNISPTAGSILGYRFSPESRKRMSLAAAGKTKSPEHIAKVAAALTGRKMTAEQCEKMRNAKIGKTRKPHSAETKEKMSLTAIGRKLSESHKANLSLAKAGKKLSAEVKANMSAAQKARHQNHPPS